MSFDTKGAIKFAGLMEQFDVYFIEAALHPDDLKDTKLSVSTSIKIAAWEEQTSRFMFIDLMDRTVDIVQPDVSSAGGLSETKRVADLANDRGVLCIPHSFKRNFGLAASIHLSAACPNSPLCEMPQSESPMKKFLTKEKFEVNSKGLIEIAERPGLGIILDENAVEKYRLE